MPDVAADRPRAPALVALVVLAVLSVGVWSLRSSAATGATAAGPVLSAAAATAPATTVAVTTPPVPPTISSPSVAPLDHGWVAVLATVDRTEGPDALEAALAPMRGVLPSARVLDSDDHPSLPPGEWVIVDGPFDSGEEAAGYCMGIGALVDRPCEGRFLSGDPADRLVVCTHDGDRLRGTCDR